MEELKNRAVVLAGAVLLALTGRDKFYRMAQDRRGLSGRVASAFCQGHAGRIGENYAIFKGEKDKDRITDIALRFYSDDSLHGFGDADFSDRADGKGLLDQQRGLIIPLVEEAIARLKPKTVVEIGAANGDVIAYLADKYPDIQFTGVDLSVVNAEKKFGRTGNQLRFEKGYALDLLNDGLSADIVFGTSTFCVLAPREFAAYLDAMPKVRGIVISDPVTFGMKHERDPEPKSRHMDLYMWWHNYFGYLVNRGWKVDHHQTVTFAYSHNPNAQVVLVSASRA